MKNEDLYQYQFESMLLHAKEIFGRPALFYSDDEDENEIETEIKAEKPLFDVSGLYFSRYKALESEYRYWVEIYIMKIIEKLLERSNYQYEEKYFGDDNEKYAICLSLGGKRVAAYFLFGLSYLEGDRTDYDKIGEALKKKSGNVDEIRLYLFQNLINEFSLATLVNKTTEMNQDGFIKVLILKDFFSELWGEKEYSLFEEYAEEYTQKINRIVGYKTVITPTNKTFCVFKSLKRKLLQELDYRSIACKGVLGELPEQEFGRVNASFLRNKMYNAMISSNDFADSFLSAEWAYDVYSNAMGELELTGIVSGYLKSIEQLLYRIARFHREEGIRIKTREGYQPYTSMNEEIIDSTLGSLRTFVFSSEAKLAISNKVRQFIRDAVELWTNYQRNGYFHKSNLFRVDNKIDEVREQTLYLYFLILGGLRYSPNQLIELGVNPLETKDTTLSFVDMYYSRFRTWFDNMINYDLPSDIPGLCMMLIPKEGKWTITTYLMKYIPKKDYNKNLAFDYRDIDTNHLKSIPAYEWEDPQADYLHYRDGAGRFLELLEKYKADEDNNLDKVNAILFAFGGKKQLVYINRQ